MKTIDLHDKFGNILDKTLVDDEDYNYLSGFKWHKTKYGYAARNSSVKLGECSNEGEKFLIFIHKVVACSKGPHMVDHINGDKLDNRRCNLRTCNKSTNGMNRGKPSHNSSGYKGVWYHKKNKKWCAEITVNGKKYSLGSFFNKDEAAIAYNNAALEHHGEFAKLNEVD